MPDTANQRACFILEVLVKSNAVINKVSNALLILMRKRATLEEKLIKSYFLKLAKAQAKIIEWALSDLAKEEGGTGQDTYVQLASLNNKILSALAEFLTAARYNLNYLEQYFEH